MSDLKAGLETYLTDLWGAPTTVTNLSRIPGGASRETYRLDADTGGVTRDMILRRDALYRTPQPNHFAGRADHPVLE